MYFGFRVAIEKKFIVQAGTVFLSPPWGGPDYLKASKYDMKTMLRPRDGYISLADYLLCN